MDINFKNGKNTFFLLFRFVKVKFLTILGFNKFVDFNSNIAVYRCDIREENSNCEYFDFNFYVYYLCIYKNNQIKS